MPEELMCYKCNQIKNPADYIGRQMVYANYWDYGGANHTIPTYHCRQCHFVLNVPYDPVLPEPSISFSMGQKQ
jgi:hypothetical protein